jgi:hypothetical protein
MMLRASRRTLKELLDAQSRPAVSRIGNCIGKLALCARDIMPDSGAPRAL